jgi:cytochrome c oxidase subunit 2
MLKTAAFIAGLFAASPVARLDAPPPTAALASQDDPKNEGVKIVHIAAERFRFAPDEIRLRLGQTAEMHLESDDTDHGFRISGTPISRIIPKRGKGSIVVSFTPDRAGRYAFECSKVCGAGHNFMHGVIVVEP